MTTNSTPPDVWKKLAEPIPAEHVSWRQQGQPKDFNGTPKALFVAYTDAQFIQERLDSVAAGEWFTSLDALERQDGDEPIAFKCTLTILGVSREDVGTGKDYKEAATDALKRAAVRFGIGRELYQDYELLWVPLDGTGRYAKPAQDPAALWKTSPKNPANRTGAVPAPVARRERAPDNKPVAKTEAVAPSTVTLPSWVTTDTKDAVNHLLGLMNEPGWEENEKRMLVKWLENKPRSLPEIEQKATGAQRVLEQRKQTSTEQVATA